MSIADANRRLLDDSRFALEDGDEDRRASRQWQSGPKTIVDIVALYRTHGHRDFIVYENERCTYAGAVRASETIANALIEAGIQAGDRVALLMRNRVEWPVLCGWLPRCKRRFDDLAVWSGAVLCPAC